MASSSSERTGTAQGGQEERSALPAVPASVLLPLLHDALQREGRFRWRLSGSSMWPTFPLDCEIEIVPLPPGGPQIGDVLVFLSRDILVAHRLVRRAGRQWVTQGDGRLGPDPPLRPEQVLGQVASASLDGRQFWPRRAEKMRAAWWVARYHLLRPARGAWRWWRRLRHGRP